MSCNSYRHSTAGAVERVKHTGFYMRHQQEVQEYYENNVTLQEKYQELKKELETVNSKIKTQREEQK